MSTQEVKVNQDNFQEAVFSLVFELPDEDFVRLLQAMLDACHYMPHLTSLCIKEGLFEEAANESN